MTSGKLRSFNVCKKRIGFIVKYLNLINQIKNSLTERMMCMKNWKQTYAINIKSTYCGSSALAKPTAKNIVITVK